MTNRNNKYLRGSIWRKWDLHVHTPLTKLNDQYEGESHDIKWDIFCEKLENSDVSVFGITDYFSFDNYIYLTKIFKEKYPESEKIFFPNVEFRIDSKNSKSDHIQIHVIFSNKKFTVDKLNDFFTRLRLVSTDNQTLNAKYCTEKDLSDVTYEKAMIKIDDLTKQLQLNFSKSEYLIVGVATGYGSLRPNGNNDNRGAEYAKEIDKICHAFFGKKANAEFFLNSTSERSDLNLLPKPVLSGSDSHSFSELDKKLGKSYENKSQTGAITEYSEITWIKADTTFEGLMQIIYEPSERIKIQEIKPDQKEDYQVISKVMFVDNNFQSDSIYLSRNLTVIIGGKSTGKSLLLRNIAQTVDYMEVENRLQTVKLDDYKKSIADFKVVWGDKQESKKGNNYNVNKKVIYIPQSYLNRLVDKEEERSSIREIIKNVLIQDENIKDVFSNLEETKRELEKNISKKIDDIFHIEEDIQLLSEDMKKTGDKKGIESEIKKLEDEIIELKNNSGISKEELEHYDILKNAGNLLSSKKESLLTDSKFLASLKSKELFNQIDFSYFSDHQLKELLAKELESIKSECTKNWHNKINDKILVLQNQIFENQNSIISNENEISPLLNKVTESKSLEDKINKIEIEEKKLKVIIAEENKLSKLKESYENTIINLLDENSKFYDKLFATKSDILEQKIISNELDFNIDIVFEKTKFQNHFINDMCNLRNINQFEEGFFSSYDYIDNSNLKKDVEKLLRVILNGEIPLKNSYSKKEAITRLMSNWFIFDYKIIQYGDEISDMSPGKKSLVLLKLLIELDSSKCPIILDQPEDDLDNRSIYNDLVQFIKTKKKERQIIIATHNPNLVVGADAECVIVANQELEGKKLANKIYKFEYIEGSLENSFFKENESKVLYKQGIQEHVCDILEGGKQAFEQRKKKYNLK